MKFLLVAINAKYIHSNLAVYSLKTYAEEYGNNNHKIEIAEYTINQYVDEILGDIYSKKPDVIAFSSYIWNIDMIKEIAADYKKISPTTDIWVGGPEVSYNTEQVLSECPYFDGIIYGEGEETFKNIVDNYNDGSINPYIIDGIAYMTGEGVQINQPQQPVKLSDIPFVYKDMRDFENKIIYYETSRGCPFSCSYCLSSIDKKLRFRDLEMVKKELKFFIDNKTAQVKFVDRTFNCNKEHAKEIWQFILDNDNGVTNFHFEVAADIMTDEEIKLISKMRPGLIQLEIGVQSTNQQTLEQINRKTDIDKIREVTAKIKEAGNIHQHLDLIAGLPYEDYRSFARSFNQVFDMKPDQLQLGFLKVLHGSAMEIAAENHKIVYSSRIPYEVLHTKWLSYDEILKLKNIEEVVEIYYNSFQFECTMDKLVRFFNTPFEMFEALGSFYKKKSVGGQKHSRVNRYKLLLEFISVYLKQKDVPEMTQMLVLDFYLRENAKSRPDFAPDISKYKNGIREFFKSEKAKEILPDYKEYDSKQMENMTHVEVFGGENYILFDYKNRNPLNKRASIMDITEWIKNND